MVAYLESSHENQAEVLRAWQRLEPYRMAIPLNANTTVAALFISNVKLALVILPRLPLRGVRTIRQSHSHAGNLADDFRLRAIA